MLYPVVGAPECAFGLRIPKSGAAVIHRGLHCLIEHFAEHRVSDFILVHDSVRHVFCPLSLIHHADVVRHYTAVAFLRSPRERRDADADHQLFAFDFAAERFVGFGFWFHIFGPDAPTIGCSEPGITSQFQSTRLLAGSLIRSFCGSAAACNRSSSRSMQVRHT